MAKATFWELKVILANRHSSNDTQLRVFIATVGQSCCVKQKHGLYPRLQKKLEATEL